MRKFLLIALGLLAALAVTVGVLAKDRLNRSYLILKNGTVIPVDRTWVAGEDLFYENDMSVNFIKRKDIQTIQKQDLEYFLDHAENELDSVLSKTGAVIKPYVHDGVERIQKIRPDPRILWGLSGLLVLMFCVRFIRRRPKKKKTPPPRPPAAPKESSSESLPNRTDIVHFFLNLYRQQLGAAADSATEIVPLTPNPSSPTLTFELRVKHRNEWVKRRMTIGPLGESSGSKSKCFYVIFDKHLVIKIPPKPLKDFEEYLAGIKKERRIVERLAPKECIVPKVSVILDQLQLLPLLAGASPEKMEESYISWLRKSVDHQAALKIRGTFVYFMDLSKYYFLSHIIDRLHDLSEPIRAEMSSTVDLVRYPDKFKERYGESQEALGSEIRKLFDRCEAETRQWLKNLGKEAVLTPYHFQSLFQEYLEKKEISAAAAGVQADLIPCITDVFSRQFSRCQGAIDTYHACVHAFAQDLVLEQNKPVMGGIVSNLLELLAWLHEKNVAMRDLKPDNILVAGNPQEFPGFLRSAADYSLGFIDVETALSLDRDAKGTLGQPLLGGTPYYATPSHLFANPVLEACLKDAGMALHLQDWHAVVVMIYKVVTGELLFDHTARLFVDVKTRVITAMRQGDSLETQMVEASRIFWRSAAHEFRTKIKANEAALRRVEAEIPKPVQVMFMRSLQMDMVGITDSIRKLVASQTHITSHGCKDQLVRAPSSRISKVMEDVLSRAWTVSSTMESSLASLRFLKTLTNLKARTERKTQWVASLSQDNPKMSAFDLLLLTFNYVLSGMYREGWGLLNEESPPTECQPDDEVSLASTL